MSEDYKSDWFIVPSRIRKLPGMTLAFLDVYETIFQFINKGKPCFLSAKTIAARTGHSLRRVQEAIAYFEENNELKHKKSGGKEYIVVPEMKIEIEDADQKSAKNRAKKRGESREVREESRIEASIPININKELNLKNINKPPTPFEKGDELDQTFNKLWERYPQKKAKQKALVAFKKIFKGKGQDECKNLLEAICGGLNAHIAEHQAKQQLKAQGADMWMPELPHLATWLNEARWEDGYLAPEEILQNATPRNTGLDLNAIESQWKYN